MTTYVPLWFHLSKKILTNNINRERRNHSSKYYRRRHKITISINRVLLESKSGIDLINSNTVKNLSELFIPSNCVLDLSKTLITKVLSYSSFSFYVIIHTFGYLSSLSYNNF